MVCASVLLCLSSRYKNKLIVLSVLRVGGGCGSGGGGEKVGGGWGRWEMNIGGGW